MNLRGKKGEEFKALAFIQTTEYISTQSNNFH